MASDSEKQVVASEPVAKPVEEDEKILCATGKDLEEFTFFQKLPVEVRLTIMRLTYPSPRKVVLNVPLFHHEEQAHEVDVKPDRYTAQLPAALHINAESRLEALKQYSIATMHDFREASLRSFGPVFFDAARDTFQLQCRVDRDVFQSDGLRQIEAICSASMSTIRRVEVIAGYRLVRYLLVGLLRINANAPPLSNFEGPFDGLLFLSGLEHVVFSMYDQPDDQTPDGVLDDLRLHIPKSLERQKERFASGRIPEVEVRRVLE